MLRRQLLEQPGEIVEILCSDPLAAIDVPNYCRVQGVNCQRFKHPTAPIAFRVDGVLPP